MRRVVIAGNWKMNMLRHEALRLIDGVLEAVGEITGIETVICPPYLYLDEAVQRSTGTAVSVGAQNAFYEKKGAYTGEISPVMLRDIGCEYVILGHSERRRYFGETNLIINKKLKASLEAGLVPVLCIGETLEQRQARKTFDVLNEQLVYGLQGIDGPMIEKMIIAYEPVWAIGTGMSATPSQAQEAHGFIRKTLKNFTGSATDIRILYGGSMNPKNTGDLLREEDIDGGLIGGASLRSESFCEIVTCAQAMYVR